LTCIIAELKSYKKQLIERIEGQRVTDDSIDEDSDDDNVKVTEADHVETQSDHVDTSTTGDIPSEVTNKEPTADTTESPKKGMY
jgi:hypothetical protein